MDEKTILIIDADTPSRHYLISTLQQQGYKILQASSGREGLITAWRDEPFIIIVDPILPDLDGKALISKLRQDQRTANTPCIALTSDTDPDRAAEYLENGYNEYLIKSDQAIAELQDLVSQLLDVRSKPKISGGLLIVFLSAKGGTGTSSLCANIAMNIAAGKPGKSVAVVDLVLPIGSIAPIVGYQGSLNINTVTHLPVEQITGGFFREHLPEPHLWQFNLLPGSPDPESANTLEVGRITDIVQTIKDIYDYILIDLGRSLSRISLPVIKQADLIVLVLSNDIGTVTLTKTVLDYLYLQGVTEQRFYLILNRAVGLEGLTKAEAEEILGLVIRTTMPYLGNNLTMANNQNLPVTLKFPHDTATMILQQTASEMSNLAQKLRER